MRQLPLAIGLAPPRTFETFVPGANDAAIVHLRLLDAPAVPAVPVYLWGTASSGKTHLLEALVHRFEERGLHVGWFDPQSAAPWMFDERWALIAIDDVDRLDAAQQHAAFTLFIEGAARSLPVAAAGRMPPVDLPLREDLRTRLGWGHVFALQPLGEPEARATLRRLADRRGIFLSDDVMDYLLTRFARDLKHLVAQLDRLDTFSLATQRTITVPLIKRMLAEEIDAA